MDRRIYSYFVFILYIKTSAANFCTIRNDDNCFYTVNCDNPTRINIIPHCNDIDPYITLVINESPTHNITTSFFNTKFDAYVRILTAVGNTWDIIQNNAFSNFKNVLYMDLSENHIKTIGKAFFGLEQLDSLNLSRNHIEILKPEAFLLSENKNSLSLLDLSYNSLTYIPDDFFMNMYNLRKLYLQGNKLTVLGDQSSANLNNLYYLNLCCSNFTALNITLRYFSNLKELDLSYNYFNNVDVMEPKSLETINLSHNNFEEVSFDDFQQFPCLEQLDLSYNQLKKLPIFSSPQNVNRTKPMIKLYLNNNNISHIDDTFFFYLNYIQVLNLSSNGMREIPKNTFKHVKILEVLSVSNIGLKLTNDTFLGLENTKIIDVSQNNLTTLNPTFFTKCTELETIVANFNNIKTVNVNLFMELVPSLTRVILEGNSIESTDPVISNKTNLILQITFNSINLITNTNFAILVILLLFLSVLLLMKARGNQNIPMLGSESEKKI